MLLTHTGTRWERVKMEIVYRNGKTLTCFHYHRISERVRERERIKKKFSTAFPLFWFHFRCIRLDSKRLWARTISEFTHFTGKNILAGANRSNVIQKQWITGSRTFHRLLLLLVYAIAVYLRDFFLWIIDFCVGYGLPIAPSTSSAISTILFAAHSCFHSPSMLSTYRGRNRCKHYSHQSNSIPPFMSII